MKKTILVLASALAIFGASQAMGAQYRSVVINHPDRSVTTVAIESDMEASVAEGNLLLSCAKGTITLPVDNVTNWTYSTEPGSSDNWTSAIESVGADAQEIDYVRTGDCIILSNLPEASKVTLVAADGRVVSAVTASCSVTLPIDNLSGGVYILSVNNNSIKIALSR